MDRGTFGGLVIKRMLLLLLGFGGGIALFAFLMMDLSAAIRYMDTEPVLSLQPAMQEKAQLSFPYTIEETPLVAERVTVYEGPYMEDGSDTEVTQVTALVLRNAGRMEVSRAEVILTQGSRQLVFRATHIPPDASVLVLEQTKGTYENAPYTACRGLAVQEEAEPLLSALKIEEVSMGTIVVTNLTAATLTDITLYYKSWLSEPGLYIGGITYETAVGTLEPGQTVQLQPEHYAAGYSKLLKAVYVASSGYSSSSISALSAEIS